MREKRKDVYKDLVPVQIIGTQRSGSNLLRVMLNQLQGVFAPHPPHILKTFHPLIQYYGDLNQIKNYSALAHDICEFVKRNPVPWLDSQLDPELILKHSRDRTLLEAYRKVHEINAIAHNAKFWFNKSMQNVYFTDLFEKENFKPYYIHLIRDGRDVALSFTKTVVGHKHMYHLAKQWREDQEFSNKVSERFAPDRAIRVKYEDLLHQPQHEIQRICAFIGLEYSNNVLKFYESTDSKITAESGEMWHNLSKPLMRNNYNKYKRELSTTQIDLFEKITGDLLKGYGYTLEDSSNHSPNTFTSEEIEEFDKINKLLKEEFLHHSVNKEDVLKRYEQDQFITQLRAEKGVIEAL